MGEESLSSPPSSLVSALKETNSKISSFSKAVEEHLRNNDFDCGKDSLDFLHVKNTMMLSYLIDLTHLVRLANSKSDHSELSTCPKVNACLSRLNEMRVAFDKMRPMEKKLRYQVDKLLSVSASVYAEANNENDSSEEHKTSTKDLVNDDPLAFKPNIEALLQKSEDVEEDVRSSSSDDDDDDMKAARSVAKSMGNEVGKQQPQVYQPPRLMAMSMADEGDPDKVDKEAAKEEKIARRKRNQMARNSELIQTLRSQYTDAPEEDDTHGGVADVLGRESALSKRLKEQAKNRKDFEEEQFVRLVVSRKEKKERNRVDAEERSNLNQLSDLGNLTRGIFAFGDEDDRNSHVIDVGRGGKKSKGLKDDGWEGRFENGKRKRGLDGGSGDGNLKRVNNETRKLKAKNSLQRELYGLNSGGKKKKGKK